MAIETKQLSIFGRKVLVNKVREICKKFKAIKYIIVKYQEKQYVEGVKLHFIKLELTGDQIVLKKFYSEIARNKDIFLNEKTGLIS